MATSKKRTFVRNGNSMQEVKPVATPTATVTATPTPAPTAAPTQEKVAVLTSEAFGFRNAVWQGLSGAKVAAVRAATSLAACVAKFGQANLPIGLTDDFRNFIAQAVENAGKPVSKAPQFTQDAFHVVVKALVRGANEGKAKEAETLSYLRAGIFNGVTGVPLEMVLLALYLRNQSQDAKKGELDLDSDGNAVVLTCGCGICNNHRFVGETWETGRGERVGNYVSGEVLGSTEKFVPVSRKCQGKINSAIFAENAPTKEANEAIAARRKTGERTEPFKAMKPMVHGITSREVGRITATQQHRQERRQASDSRLAAIVGGIKAPTRTGMGQGGASAYPSIRPGVNRKYGDQRSSRF